MLNPRSIPACGELFDIEMIDDPIHRSALACAGNSHSCWIFNINQSVHPRLRGELNGQVARRMYITGSSPLTRGTPSRSHKSPDVHRFIPAYAGNSMKFVSTPIPPPVHPRLRGELKLAAKKNAAERGSSPLTRGTRLQGKIRK